MRVETVEAVFPKDAVPLHPLRRIAEPSRLEPCGTQLRIPPPRDEAGVLEHLEVLRNRGKRHVERLRELGDRSLPRREAREDRPPGRVGDGSERRAQAVGRHGLCCTSRLNNYLV